MATVLLTDFPWGDDKVERQALIAAGHRLVPGPGSAVSPTDVEALAKADPPSAIMTCWAQVSARAMDVSPDLKLVARMGVGLDNIDVAAAAARGVQVTNVPDYCVEEVSDHAVAMLLALARGVVRLDARVKAGAWDTSASGMRRVRDMTIGLVGLGRIGARTAAKLRGFGVRLIGATRSGLAAPGVGVEVLPLPALLAQSDAVVILAPLTPQTHHLFDDAAFAGMRPGAFLVNVSRGAIVDTDALVRALTGGRLAGAALDVVENEPTPAAALAGRPDVIITPHVAYSSAASILELRTRVSEEVVRVLGGEAPHHLCPPPT